ncbi:hypothetical protein D5F01_LYC23747 [Larimichthys crocea]|uniref:Uncharacterized protein n=1 Tax=Larimichthys crocea TaxID=215358 RepID=A0A6G0HFZ5_LARCR|nr:hypothetical protein D5F01_LYC23747 [Larimichthys crocea]
MTPPLRSDDAQGGPPGLPHQDQAGAPQEQAEGRKRGQGCVQQREVCVYTFTNTAPTRQTPCPSPTHQPTNTIREEGRRGRWATRSGPSNPPLRGEGRTSRDRALPSQVPQEKEGTRPAVLPLPPGTPKTPILSQKTFTGLQLNPRVPPGERPGPAPTERCLPERARRRRKGSAMPKHHFPRTSKTPMLKSKMPPTEQKGNGTAEASAFPVHSREGVTRASRDRALPPWPLQASRLG